MADSYGKLTITGLTALQQTNIVTAFNANVDRTKITIYSLFWDASGNLSIEAGGPDVSTALGALNTRANQLLGKSGVVSTLDTRTTKMRTGKDARGDK